MPKDEFDFNDPMELSGVALLSEEDTADAMTECFIEEFMHLGHNHKQLLAMFRNKHYIGMHMVLENRGEDYIKRRIQEVFAQWGRPFDWNACNCGKPHTSTLDANLETRGGVAASSQIDEQHQSLFLRPRRGGEGQGEGAGSDTSPCSPIHEQEIPLDSSSVDPMGAPVPKLQL